MSTAPDPVIDQAPFKRVRELLDEPDPTTLHELNRCLILLAAAMDRHRELLSYSKRLPGIADEPKKWEKASVGWTWFRKFFRYDVPEPGPMTLAEATQQVRKWQRVAETALDRQRQRNGNGRSVPTAESVPECQTPDASGAALNRSAPAAFRPKEQASFVARAPCCRDGGGGRDLGPLGGLRGLPHFRPSHRRRAVVNGRGDPHRPGAPPGASKRPEP
jgi:hypothetical protein